MKKNLIFVTFVSLTVACMLVHMGWFENSRNCRCLGIFRPTVTGVYIGCMVCKIKPIMSVIPFCRNGMRMRDVRGEWSDWYKLTLMATLINLQYVEKHVEPWSTCPHTFTQQSQ